MANQNVGKVTQIIGAVLDIKFSDGNLPEINDAINIPKKDGSKLVVGMQRRQEDRSVSLSVRQPWDVSLTYSVNQSTKNRLRKE